MNRLTYRFLQRCRKYGIKRVCIGVAHRMVKCSVEWKLSGISVDHSVFARQELDGWPAIWRVVEELEISGGCGNSDQHALKPNHGLDRGAYRLVEGKWSKEA